MSAEKHPAYNDALQRATNRAAAGYETSVYWDGKAIYLRSFGVAAPARAQIVCVVQRWDDKTVQLRFAGARSEWVSV